VALRELKNRWASSRLSFFEFGRGDLVPIDPARWPQENGARGSLEPAGQSDLMGALEQLEGRLGEKPSTVVVISDGRLSRPAADASDRAFAVPGVLRGTVLHTINVGGASPKDASIVNVASNGNAVAHQHFSLEVTVGCFGGLSCSRVPLTVREHRKGSPPAVIASGDAVWDGGVNAKVSFELTIERAGTRVIELVMVPPKGDQVPENDSRMLTIQVVRERLRLLHVAGRPTYDVRAMRNWLKSDKSVDLVSFFILRTDADETNSAEESELSLIPFPVDELFDEHLPSFDAVLLADIDAERYRVSRYFGNLARYVENGGGLLLIGGPSAFAGGGYADSPIERVLPITLTRSERPFDTTEFVPRWTNAGKSAALLAPLRALTNEEIPSMPGANTFGPARDGAVVLWDHPSRHTLPLKSGSVPGAMPVLAVSEVGDGRVVAMGVDGTHRLAFGSDAFRSAGRAHGALWDGLLGWAIRDPRFESMHGEIIGECLASSPVAAHITLSSPSSGELVLEVHRLDGTAGPVVTRRVSLKDQMNTTIDLGLLGAGAYTSTLRFADEPTARFDFACEAGGSAWADSRPDPERLRRLATINHGSVVSPDATSELTLPPPTVLHGSRSVRPLLSAWVWALIASLLLAANWLLRRIAGLS
ncbi:MAG TPA: hypothetical protein VKP30_21045, partial [Polyangiaceae bacterium]|nr:hypothetical protein [Polyangiaceae bacterium]